MDMSDIYVCKPWFFYNGGIWAFVNIQETVFA